MLFVLCGGGLWSDVDRRRHVCRRRRVRAVGCSMSTGRLSGSEEDQEGEEVRSADQLLRDLSDDYVALGTDRLRIRKLERNLKTAERLERYDDAKRFQDELRMLRRKDPVMLYDDMKRELAEAEKVENYKKCITLRDTMNELRARMPQYRLQGLWGGELSPAPFS